MNRSSFAAICALFSALSLGLQACGDDNKPAQVTSDVAYPLSRTDPAATLDFDPAEYKATVAPPARARTASKPDQPAELKKEMYFNVKTQKFIDLAELAPPEQQGIARPLADSSRGSPTRGLMLKRDLERAGLSADDPGALEKLDAFEDRVRLQQAAIGGAAAIVEQGDTTTWEGRTTVKLFIDRTNGEKSYCSGKLISSRTVITSGHCLWLTQLREGKPVTLLASKIRVVPGSEGSYMPYGDANATDWYIDADWRGQQDNDEDWAIVWLDRNIGDVTGAFGLRWTNDDDWYLRMGMDMWGYPDTLGGSRLARSPGTIICVDAWMVHSNASHTGGFSGAGVHVTSGAHKGRVYGVHRGGSYNNWCQASQMTGAVKINEQRYNFIVAHLDQGTPIARSMAGWAPLGGLATFPIAAVSMAPNRNDLFVHGLTNNAHRKWQDGSIFSPADGGWESLDGQMIGKVAVASRAPNTFDLFVRTYGTPAAICSKAWTGTSWAPSLTGWWCFDDSLIRGSPSVTSTRFDRLNVFGRQTGGKVIEKAWTGQAGWLAPIDLGGKTDRDVAVDSRQEYMWDAFIRHADTKELCTKARFGGTLTPSGTSWHCFPGTVVDSEPTVVSSGPNNLDVFYVDPDHVVMHMFWRGGTWQGPFSVGGWTTGSVAAVSRSANQIDIFIVGQDGSIQSKANNGSGWSPSQTGWWPLGGDMLDVTATSWGQSRIDLYARDRNLQPRHRFWNGTWSN